MITFNPTIDLGSLVAAVLALAGGVVAVRLIGWRVGRLEQKVDKIDMTLEKVAVQDSRINRLEEDVRELRHGDGFVLPLPGPRGPS